MRRRRGILLPFRRDPTTGLAEGEGADVDDARVQSLLRTRGNTPIGPGEMPWRPAFGVGLDIYRHRPNSPALGALVGRSIQLAFRRWLPDLELVRVIPTRSGNVLTIQVMWRRPPRTETRTTTTTVER